MESKSDKKVWQKPECVELDVQETEFGSGNGPDGAMNEDS